MARSLIIALLIIIAVFVAFEFAGSSAGAQDAGSFARIIDNQETILEKLDDIESKLNVIRVRLR